MRIPTLLTKNLVSILSTIGIVVFLIAITISSRSGEPDPNEGVYIAKQLGSSTTAGSDSVNSDQAEPAINDASNTETESTVQALAAQEPEVQTVSTEEGSSSIPTAVGTHTELTFANILGTQEESAVVITGELSAPANGICAYELSVNGSVQISTTTTITNSTICKTTIPTTQFPEDAVFNYALTFTQQ